MNNNRNPEQERQQELFQKRERARMETHSVIGSYAPVKMNCKQRVEILRGLIAKTHPEKTKAWQERRLRELLGTPARTKQASTAPIRKQAPQVETAVRSGKTPAIYAEINQRIAHTFGLEIPKNSPVMYR